jgi:nicotinate-nucleotide adenylyltransferase
VAPGLRIGLLGGSFNPPHEGHLHVSEVALKQLDLDYVWWLVTPQNPLKGTAGLAPLSDRMRQARMIARHPRIVVMDIERALGTHYSVDTLTALQRRFPLVHFFWLMGSDNLAIFRRWRRWQEIARRVPVAVVQRPGSVLAQLSAMPMQHAQARRRIVILDGRRNELSSTALRARERLDEAVVRTIPPC